MNSKLALLQVVEVLEELENVESLYPTLKAVGKEHPFYATEQFQASPEHVYVCG